MRHLKDIGFVSFGFAAGAVGMSIIWLATFPVSPQRVGWEVSLDKGCCIDGQCWAARIAREGKVVNQFCDVADRPTMSFR